MKKKNRLMRFAAVLLVLTLMTSCFVGGTFAKYVTTDSASDTARVAKWGIEVLASGNLFGTDYAAHDETNSDEIIAVNTSNSVNSAAPDNDLIVAPGTKNDTGLTIAITGTPEVSYNVSAKTGSATAAAVANEDIFLGEGTWGVMVEATGLNDATDITKYYVKTATPGQYEKATGIWVSGTKYYELHDEVTIVDAYYPVKWNVVHTDAATEIDATDKNLPEIADEMVSKLVNTTLALKKSGYGNANVDAAASYTLTWAWAFTGQDDKADTILGNLMANSNVFNETDGDVVILDGVNYVQPTDGTDYNLDIVFNFAVTVEQTN